MKNYKAMYIHDVVRRLPKQQREDVSKELESLIDDMLESGMELDDVLQELGHPSELASKYREKPRYLISPDMFDQYLSTLKLVLPILAAVGLVLGMVEQLIYFYIEQSFIFSGIQRSAVFFGKLIGSGIENGVNLVFYGLVVITIVYAVIDYTQKKKEKKLWRIDDLPEVPNEKLKKISRSETIVELVFSVLFMGTFLFLLETDWFAIIRIHTDTEIIPVLNTDVLKPFLPFILALFALSIFISVVKIICKHWNFPLAHAVLIHNILSIILVVYVVWQNDLITLQFIEFLKDNLPIAFNITQVIAASKFIFVAIVSVSSVVEIALDYYRAYHNYDILHQ